MDDRTKTAARNFDRATGIAKTAVQNSHLPYAAAVENACEFNAKLVDMVRANAEVALEAATQIASAKNPADLAQAWSTHATKQYAMLTDQARELTAVWQKFFVPPR